MSGSGTCGRGQKSSESAKTGNSLAASLGFQHCIMRETFTAALPGLAIRARTLDGPSMGGIGKIGLMFSRCF